MTRSYVDFLRDMMIAAQDARSFVDGLTLADLQASKEKQYAVIRALEILGEAAAHIPLDIRERYDDIPWREIVGMRNVVIHAYFGVDESVVWRTVTEELPSLQDRLWQILRELGAA
jgi:uncharacterized protein with HEPN domain